MSGAGPADSAGPQLSMYLPTFAAEGPDSWEPVLGLAVAMDRAGVDRLAVSDHVVFGERLDRSEEHTSELQSLA